MGHQEDIMIQTKKLNDEILNRILIANDIKWMKDIKEFIKIKDELIEEAINLINMFIKPTSEEVI